MTHTLKASLRLILAGMMTVLLTTGCASYQKANNGLLTINQQVCRLKPFTHLRENDSEMGISIDIPVEGPQAMIDSITVFFNEELYRYFDNGENIHVPYEEVFSTDLANLTDHYRKVYRPFYDENNPDVTEFNTHWLELNMAAQTETFVTYEVVWDFMGEGLEQARRWTTFVKQDGHRLKEVITSENMLRFYEDYPELKDDDIWCNAQHDLEEGYEVFLNNTGLLAESLAFQYVWNMGIFEDYLYPLTVIKPYLSEEAQELVSGNDLFHKELIVREIEHLLGITTTVTGEKVYLAAWGDAVTAYTKSDSGYMSIEVFEIGEGYRRFINTLNCSRWYESNPNDRCFAFNKADNTLYVPKVKVMAKNGGKETVPYYDRYYVYQFDGEHFICKGEDGGFWLHPSIRQFEALVYYGKTEDYQVRVDSLADRTYRLTAWKNKDDMNDAPDILVEGGVLLKSIYVFKNEDYTYTVIDQEFGQDKFRSYDKNGKLFISKKLNKVYN